MGAEWTFWPCQPRASCNAVIPSRLTGSIAAPASSRAAMTRCTLRFDRVHQRRPPFPVAGVHVGARLQEHIDCGMIPASRCQTEW